jgi:type I restriction enzyme, S subunit
MTDRFWPTVQLGNYCSKIGSGSTPRGGESVYSESGVSFIRSQNIYNGFFAPEGLAYLDEHQAEQLAGVTVQSGDVLLNITGDSVARCCRVPDDVLPARVNQHVAIIRPKSNDFDSRFIGYLFISPFMQDTMLSLAGSGGTRKALTKEMIERFEVPLPPPPVQARIANILSTYDTLIMNNRRRIALLEETGRHVYREWFVRFRFPGHEHTPIISGDVPCGWQRRTLAQCVAFRSGGTPNKAVREYWDGKIPWVSSGEMTQTRLYDTPLRITREAAEAGSRLVRRGTILIVVRGMSLAKEFRIATVAREMAFNQDLKALECKEDVEPGFLFHYLLDQRDRIRELATEASHGTKKLETAVLERLPVVVPDGRLQRHFSDFVRDFTGHRDVLHRQNERLTAARDLLLPRLMSGEITV